MTTARDVLDCARIARQHAEELRHNAPPPAIDKAAHDHNIRVAQGWEYIESAHIAYADELEGRDAA